MINLLQKTHKMIQLSGTGAALFTPFGPDSKIDYPALSALIDHVIGGGVNYIVALGTTAETPTLTVAEKNELTRFIAEKTACRVPLVLGIGGNNTRALTEQIAQTDLTPFTAILSVVPYYNKPNQEGIYRHFEAIANASPVPVILYNVPGRTGVNMTAETTLRLATDFPNIRAIKEASGNMDQIRQIIAGAPEGFLTISGDDSLAVSVIEAGGAGVISVLADTHPAVCSRMVDAALAGNLAEARRIENTLLPFIKYLFEEGNPVGIKCSASALGLCADTVRLPLVCASDTLKGKITAELTRIAE